MSDRMNAHKKKYFRLDVMVGKLEIHNCDDLLSFEDILCLRMKEQFLDYENQVSLAMIPFYQQRLQHLNETIRSKRGDPGTSQEDITFLEKTKVDMQKNLDREKTELNEKAQALYNTWL